MDRVSDGLPAPSVLIFDWHATLVDTLDAMYHAVDDMFPDFHKLGLMPRMVAPEDSKTPEDAKLVAYVREFAQLHPKVKADRKISRTDIFEVLFGEDQEAKQLAVQKLDYPPDPSVWYVGDSTTDVIAAKRAGMTSVFFNGAQWDQLWLNQIFPATHKHPDKPDVVVNDFSEFWALVLACEVGPP